MGRKEPEERDPRQYPQRGRFTHRGISFKEMRIVATPAKGFIAPAATKSASPC